MLGSNPSADSGASTDEGDATASPFRYLLAQSHREKHESDKSWGAGQSPAGRAATQTFLSSRGALS